MKERLVGIGLACLLCATGVVMGAYITVISHPKPVPTPVPQLVYTYNVYHTDTTGEPQKNFVSANAVDIKGNCILFFKDFHINAIVCPGSMEKVVVIDENEP